MVSKTDILEQIKRTTFTNGGVPLGVARFENETGIRAHEWGRYWARFGDILREAGIEPNQWQGAYSDELLIEKLVALIRKLGKFPTYREIEVERRSDSTLPTPKAFKRLGSKEQLAKLVNEYCSGREGFDDVAIHCNQIASGDGLDTAEERDADVQYGEVYLFKSGRYFKIGRTIDTVRRGNEIRIQLPEKMTLIHSIKTDDPSGIEAYWHRRFETKRMNGEWFDLNAAEIKAFKRWRRIS